MQARQVRSRKTGRKGWQFRFMDPARGVRTRKTIWLGERREAERAFKNFLDGREARKLGLPDNSGWEVSYEEAVARFLKESPIPSDVRRDQLKLDLGRNLLNLHVLAELGNIGTLTTKCHRLLDNHKDIYVIKNVQQPLKQLAAWCASVGLLPYNPLAAWKKLRRSSEEKRPRAFLPGEIRAILEAADELDQLLNRPFPLAIIFKTLLVTGNRPTAIFNAKIADLHSGRIHLSPGVGTKRNGVATIPAEFEAELRSYLTLRKTSPEDPLLLSPMGMAVSTDNINDDFKRATILAFVKLLWPVNDPATAAVEPVEVATRIVTGRRSGFDGAPPRDPIKIANREKKTAALEELAEKLVPEVDRRLIGRPMYALRATHISWARNLPVNNDSIKAQVGHAPRDIEEKHYLDPHLIDPNESSQAVWDILTGARELKGRRKEAVPMRLAAGAELQTMVLNLALNEKSGFVAAKNGPQKPMEGLENTAAYKSGGYRDRTGDLQTASLTLSQL